MSSTINERHNIASRVLFKGISKGPFGVGLASKDIGSADRRVPDKQRLTSSRPDATLVVPMDRVPRTNCRYLLRSRGGRGGSREHSAPAATKLAPKLHAHFAQYAYKLASTRRALVKTSFNSHQHDQARATASNPPDPHWLLSFVSLGEWDTRCLGPSTGLLKASSLKVRKGIVCCGSREVRFALAGFKPKQTLLKSTPEACTGGKSPCISSINLLSFPISVAAKLFNTFPMFQTPEPWLSELRGSMDITSIQMEDQWRRKLGPDHQQASKLARELHARELHSVMYANKLGITRRAIENKNDPHSQVLEPGASATIQIPTSPSFS
eukprot:1160841-Pelagomonas_calceolata.AAC.2